MGTIASQITSLTIFYSTVYSDADQRKHQSSASLAFVWGIHWGPVNSPHKWPVTRKVFPFDYVIMLTHGKGYGKVMVELGIPFQEYFNHRHHIQYLVQLNRHINLYIHFHNHYPFWCK